MNKDHKYKRNSPIEMNAEQFRTAGHQLVDQIAEFLESLPQSPLTSAETPSEIRAMLGDNSLPLKGSDAESLLAEVSGLLFKHSLFNGHPKFLGYITSSPAPIGALADMLVAAINPNAGAWSLSPVASEIEWQTIRWIAEMIGYPSDCGGILVSGGNMANMVCYLTARQIKAHWNIEDDGVATEQSQKMLMYGSPETHSWIRKAATLFGSGMRSIRWIKPDEELKMSPEKLHQQIKQDIKDGYKPFMIVATGGSVGTGAVDPLPELYRVAQEFDLWFHVDGAYGAFAAMLPDAPEDLLGLKYADSIALDPHKWLYAPLEAGCALVRNKQQLKDTFSYHPPYYKFAEFKGEKTESFFDYGLQNSRGFRALKVWLCIKQVGLDGYRKMISEDIELAKYLYQLAEKHPHLEAITNNLSITTFRYISSNLKNKNNLEYLNNLNMELLTRLQEGGEAYVSNAWINGIYALRACFVNFRTSEKDVEELVEIILNLGKQLENP